MNYGNVIVHESVHCVKCFILDKWLFLGIKSQWSDFNQQKPT